MSTRAAFGIQGILGINLLAKLNLIMDLANRQLMQCKKSNQHGLIPAPHWVTALKAPENIIMPKWESDITEVVMKYPGVLATHILQYGKIVVAVRVDGPDPRPLKQYRYPAAAIEGLEPTIKALVQQGVLRETESSCNSPIWPVLKADHKTWHLTVDHHELNHVTRRLAPVVELCCCSDNWEIAEQWSVAELTVFIVNSHLTK